VGLDRPEEGDGDVFPLVAVASFSVFSIAFAAAVLAPSSADASGLLLGAAGVGTPMDRTLVFGAAAAGVSPPIERVLTTGGPEDVAGFGKGAGAGFVAEAAVGEGAGSAPDGLLAITGGLCGIGCCC